MCLIAVNCYNKQVLVYSGKFAIKDKQSPYIQNIVEKVWVNLAGLPGLALPVGFTAAGMPVGGQLIGAPGSEERLLAAGMAVQNALMPDWIAPPVS